MTYARKAFRFIQISNVEGTPGTAEAATEVVSGVSASGYFDKVIHYPEEDRNSLSMHHANDLVVGREFNGTISGDLNQRIACWLFSNTLCGNITPTQPNATTKPNAYLWTFAPGLTTANTPDITAGIDTFTIELGDTQQAYETEFVFTRTLTITGAPNSPITYSWDFTGRQLTETTKTPVLVMPAVQRFPFNLGTFYVDASWAGLGGTVKAGELLGFTATFETQFTPLYATDGALYFSAVNEDKKTFCSLDLTYRRGTNSELEKDKYDARTTTFLRLKILGATVLDAGQSNPPYIIIDGAYRYTEWGDLGDEGGSSTVSVKADSLYDATGAAEVSVQVYTDLAAYP